MAINKILINNKFVFTVQKESTVPIVKGNITSDYINWVKNKSFYLATMPRSGTNYMTYFFNYYDMALSGRLNWDNPIPIESVKSGWNGNMEFALGFKWFLISHNNCPGFESLCDENFKQKWNTILTEYYDDSNDLNYLFLIEKFKDILYPKFNQDVKILFLYRNPLDQIISLSRHFKNHINPLENSKLDSIGSILMMTNRYIKLYLTYSYMIKQYPNNIKILSYEKLLKNPKDEIANILKYYSFDLSIGNRMDLFEKTLELVTPKALKELEHKMGQTLAGDQKVSSNQETHMRSGKTGNWKNFFKEKELYIIEKRFNQFDLTLNQFDGIEYIFDKKKLDKIDIDSIMKKEKRIYYENINNLYINKINNIFKEKTIIYGTGLLAKKLFGLIENKSNIIFTDSNSKLWNTTIYGIKVIPNTDILEYTDKVLIASEIFFDEISSKLINIYGNKINIIKIENI